MKTEKQLDSTIVEICCGLEYVFPEKLWEGGLSQQGETLFDNYAIWSLDCPVLFVGMWTGDTIVNAMGLQEV